MSRGAYYNEIDPYAAQWLRNLIAAGHIAPGDVDERDIRLVRPDDLRGYRQCHFFAGIGVWSYALRLAGWQDDEEVWTGSCPCQPFSDAGAGEAFDDERDLWPDWFPLIRERRPVAVFGEQVASRLGLAWIDALHADLEGEAYTVGAVDTCSAGFGSPNIRQRLFWVADADEGQRRSRWDGPGGESRPHAESSGRSDLGFMAEPGEGGRAVERSSRLHADGKPGHDAARCSEALRLGEPSRTGPQGHERPDNLELHRTAGQVRSAPAASVSSGLAHAEGEREGAISRGSRKGVLRAAGDSATRGLAVADGGLAGDGGIQRGGEQRLEPQDGSAGWMGYAESRGCGERRDEAQPRRSGHSDGSDQDHRPGPLNGFWRAADWLCCTDGKWRPVEPGTFPLVTGATGRLGRLRAYGNAINPEGAAYFIRAYREIRCLR